MQALILAAGQGRRLRDRLGRPKCLRRMGGTPLIEHQVNALAAVGVDDVVVVVGFGQQQVRDSLGERARYVVNDRFAETNSMYSFLLGSSEVHDDVVVMNSDVFFYPAMLARLLGAGGDALVYDSGSGGEEEQMKVALRDGVLVEMSKALPPHRVSGENVGLLRFSATTAAAVADAATAQIEDGGERAWLASAVNCVAARHPIRAIDVTDLPWVEIDFPSDLVRARAETLPAVLALMAHSQAPVLDSLQAIMRSVS